MRKLWSAALLRTWLAEGWCTPVTNYWRSAAVNAGGRWSICNSRPPLTGCARIAFRPERHKQRWTLEEASAPASLLEWPCLSYLISTGGVYVCSSYFIWSYWITYCILSWMTIMNNYQTTSDKIILMFKHVLYFHIMSTHTHSHASATPPHACQSKHVSAWVCM